MKIIKGMKKPQIKVYYLNGRKVGYCCDFENGYRMSIRKSVGCPLSWKDIKELFNNSINEYLEKNRVAIIK